MGNLLEVPVDVSFKSVKVLFVGVTQLKHALLKVQVEAAHTRYYL